jgi:hypothetical protein
MKNHSVLYSLAAILLCVQTVRAQINLSAGTYRQDFNTLTSSPSGNTNWADDTTLSSWYVSQSHVGSITNYRVSAGSSTGSGLYSFGASGDTNRALGSMAGGTPVDIAFGVRFTNDTLVIVSNFTVSYTGEQWRRANTVTQALAFYYYIGASPLTNADAKGTAYAWTPVSALDFQSPNIVGAGTSLDGLAATNRQVFSNLLVTNVLILPGQELFLRWLDLDDSGNDHGLAIDDLAVEFGIVSTPLPIPLTIQLVGPQRVLTWSDAAFHLQAAGSPDGPFTNVVGATSPHTNVTAESRMYFRLKTP